MSNADQKVDDLDTERIDQYAYPKAGHDIEFWERIGDNNRFLVLDSA